MSKKILSLDLGITSIGYCILDEMNNDRYSLLDYGVSMFDKPTDKDNKSKKLLYSQHNSTTNLYGLRKDRKENLAELFEKFGLGSSLDLLGQERDNIYVNKWELRAKKAFEQKLSMGELFSVLYLIAKHRGYKSLDTDDLLEDLMKSLGFTVEEKNTKKDDEKGKIKKSLQTIELLKEENPNKTVAQIIYELESAENNPTYRNHDNYTYMIRRKYIREEIEKLIESQDTFGLFENNFDVKNFTNELLDTIDDQKDSTNDLSLFSNCQYYPEHKVAHQYSLLADIFKMYQSVANITFNSKKDKISKEQIKLIADDFFKKIAKSKNIADIKYQDIRKVLKLDDNTRVHNKEDYRLDKKGKKDHATIIKFHFLSSLGKIDKTFIVNTLQKDNRWQILKEIFDVLEFEKAPRSIYDKLKVIFDKYDLVANSRQTDETIIALIKYKSGSSLRVSHYAMIEFIPYFGQGLTMDNIKEKLGLERQEDYSQYKKGIKYLGLATDKYLTIKSGDKESKASQYEYDDQLLINNHPVKYVVSATMRLIKHLHTTYGTFDEIRVESTRELSQNDETKKAIKKANDDNEKRFQEILDNKEYQQIANDYNVNLKKYARKLMMWEEQEELDIYTGKTIGMHQIFNTQVDIDHIIPQSLGGLSVKHNLILCSTDANHQKGNRLPMQYTSDREAYINRVEHLWSQYKLNWKKKKTYLLLH